jgi:hypothetical protein
MLRRHRLLSGAILGLGLLALAGGLLYRYALPPFAEAKIRAALAQAGLPDAEFRLDRITLSGATLSGIRLDREGRLTAGEVRVTLALPRIDTVTVTGLRFLIRTADGRLDLGPLDALRGSSSEPGTPGPAPLRRLALTDARVTLEAFGETRDFAVEGGVDFRADGRVEPRLRVTGEDLDLRLSGDLATSGGGGRLEAHFEAGIPRIEAGPVTITNLVASGRAVVADLSRIASAEINLRAGSVAAGGYAAESVAVRLRGSEAALGAEVDARFAGLAVRLRGIAAPSDPRAWFDGARTLAGRFEARGRPEGTWLPAEIEPGSCVATGAFEIDLREERARVASAEVRFGGATAGPCREGRGFLRFSGEVGPEGIAARALPGSTVSARHADEEIGGEAELEAEARFAWTSAGGVSFEAPDILVAGRASGLYGFEGEVRLRVGVSGSTSLVSVRAFAGLTTLARRAGEEPAASAGLAEEAVFRWTPGGDWVARAPAVHVMVGPESWPVVPGALELAHLRAMLDLDVAATPEGVEAHALPGALLSADSIQFIGPDGVRLGPGSLAVRELTASYVPGEGLRAAGAVETTGPSEIAGPLLTGVLAGLSVAGDIALPHGSGPTASLRAAASFVRLHLPGPDVLLTGVRVELPFHHDAAGPRAGPGTLVAGELAVARRRLPGFAADLAPEGDGVALQCRWAITPGATLEVRGLVHLFGEEVFARTEVSMPSCSVAADDLLGRLLLRETGAGVTGRFSLSGSARIGREGTSAAFDLAALEARVSLGEDAVVAEGVRAKARLLSSDGFRIEGESGFEWRGIRMGEFQIGKGSGRVEAGDFSTISIRDLRFSMGLEGRFLVDDFTFESAAPEIRTIVRVVNWDLADWLALASGDKVRGRGRLWGNLPVLIRPGPPLHIGISGGSLKAEGGGTLEILDPELAESVLASLPEDEYGKLVKDRVVQSLRDFAFKTLSFDFVAAERGQTLSVRTKGAGRTVPQELDLTVNFREVERTLRDILAVKFGLDRVKARGLE